MKGDGSRRAQELGRRCSADPQVRHRLGPEDEFTADSLVEMEDQFSGFLGAALNAYDRAIYHGRVGN